MINAEPVVHGRPHSVPPREPRQAEGPTLFRFPFQKRYGGLYSNRHDKFVLREEHVAELKRLVVEHNRDGSGHVVPLSMSDIVNTALLCGECPSPPLSSSESENRDGLSFSNSPHKSSSLHITRRPSVLPSDRNV